MKCYQELLSPTESIKVVHIVIGADEPGDIINQFQLIKIKDKEKESEIPAQTIIAIVDNFSTLQRRRFLPQRPVECHRFDAHCIDILVMLQWNDFVSMERTLETRRIQKEMHS